MKPHIQNQMKTGLIKFEIHIQNRIHSQVRDIIEQRGHKIPDPDLEINIPGSKTNAHIRSHIDATFVVVSRPTFVVILLSTSQSYWSPAATQQHSNTATQQHSNAVHSNINTATSTQQQHQQQQQQHLGVIPGSSGIILGSYGYHFMVIWVSF